ncbi:MAG: 6-phosphogluconolactonase, partial [Burkholderiaceae bacterium]
MLVPPEILVAPRAEWPNYVSKLILAEIRKRSLGGRRAAVMLTGGRSARVLYAAWARSPAFLSTGDVDFYLGDERCVPADDEESNSGMVMRNLFGDGVPPGCRFFPMATEGDKGSRARDYEKMLPERVDVLLLSVGEDGHVASLFPGGAALNEESRRVM